MHSKLIGAGSLLLLLLAGAAAPLAAQSAADWQDGLLQLERGELEELQRELEETAQSGAYSDALRGQARREAELVKDRLERGDFQVGDQIALVVEGEDTLSGTYPVRPGRVITLPVVGDVPLDGVLRSELETHLHDHLARYIRDPVVHTRSLFRIAILGAVGRPGFHLVRAEMILADAIMEAGGPSSAAKLEAITIVRSGETIWRGAELQQAITEGRTLDRMSLRAGDQIVIPSIEQAGGIGRTLQRALLVIPTIIVAITGLMQIL